jgi:hypothetical protein
MNVIDQRFGEGWAMYLGDSCEVVKAIPDNTIHYSIFSPPFISLYTYSASERDMGNARSDKEFFEHFEFLVSELYRVTMPGRLLSFHCMNIPSMKERDGVIGLKDFRGDLIRVFQKPGFIFHSEAVIWKDPLIEATRTKAIGLMHKQVTKDSSMSRQGLPDYLITMRKPGENKEPIARPDGFTKFIGEDEPKARKVKPIIRSRDIENYVGVTKDDPVYSHQVWRRYASPVWMDINQSRTLQKDSAREAKDERHICLASGSLVLTREHGYLEIEEVELGDHVLTHRGRWMPVLAKTCNGIEDVIRVCGQGIADLQLTPTHRVWTRRATGSRAKESAMRNEPEWVDAHATLGSYLNLQLPPEEPSALTPEEWWIVGRWLGDGHRGGHRRSGKRGGLGQFFISCSHDESKQLIDRLGRFAGHAAERTATQIALVNLRDEVRDVLDRCGNGAAGKRLPGEAVALPQSEAEALLNGYLSADGCYVGRHDRFAASSISRGLLLGLAIVAQRARAVVASVYAGRPEREGEIEGRPVKMRQDWIFAFRNSDGYKKSGWVDEWGAWKKVRRIEVAGSAEVWDLTVAEDASFTAEGAVVHNCPLQLDVIERAIELWTNHGDTVLSPFAGIGSEGYVAIQRGRRFLGIELKESYFKQACGNLRRAEEETPRDALFATA